MCVCVWVPGAVTEHPRREALEFVCPRRSENKEIEVSDLRSEGGG